jgi:hypothetical protein
MKFQVPAIDVGIKGTRGLAGMSAIYQVRPEVLVAVDVSQRFGFVALKPGEETAVAVSLPGVPLNADIKKLNAQIEIRAGSDSEKSSLKQTSTVQEGNDEKTYNVDIEVPALPRNLSLKLDGGEVFWTSSSATVEGIYDLPEFVEQVNSYLDKLPAGSTKVDLVFLVSSDGPGQVKITVDESSLEYSAIQTQAWPNPLDDTVRLDRNLQLDFGNIERVQLDALPAGDRGRFLLDKVSADVGGQFGEERLFTSVATHSGKEFATISNDYSLAQAFELTESIVSTNKPLHAAGIAGLFQVDDKLELYVEIQEDSGGFPSAKPPLAKSNLTLVAGSGGEVSQWNFATFEQPVDLKLDTAYWIVFKGIQGNARLALGEPSEDYLGRVVVNRGGQLWKSINRKNPTGTSALVRLVYLPEIDNQLAAIEIGIEGAAPLERLNPGAAQTISLKAPAGLKTAEPVIIIKSHARGTLTIANVIQEYALS